LGLPLAQTCLGLPLALTCLGLPLAQRRSEPGIRLGREPDEKRVVLARSSDAGAPLPDARGAVVNSLQGSNA
jgi:hypothetical protein